mmetsp:Transcript_25408/g.22428  ORF Transcript_25408/g.22428 Transcript_25408/m.22428 type:complete len:166 (+) Transcript_25408:327-824(+)
MTTNASDERVVTSSSPFKNSAKNKGKMTSYEYTKRKFNDNDPEVLQKKLEYQKKIEEIYADNGEKKPQSVMKSLQMKINMFKNMQKKSLGTLVGEKQPIIFNKKKQYLIEDDEETVAISSSLNRAVKVLTDDEYASQIAESNKRKTNKVNDKIKRKQEIKAELIE